MECGPTFSADFFLIDGDREEHRTSCGAVQPFTWVVLRREEPLPGPHSGGRWPRRGCGEWSRDALT